MLSKMFFIYFSSLSLTPPLLFLHKLPLLVPAFSSPSNAFKNVFQLFIFFSTLQRPQCITFKTKKGTARWQCQFLHSCFSDGLPILLQENTVGGPNVGIYKSLTDTWTWKLGLRPRNFIYVFSQKKENFSHRSKFWSKISRPTGPSIYDVYGERTSRTFQLHLTHFSNLRQKLWRESIF